jgi:hypothetical protein
MNVRKSDDFREYIHDFLQCWSGVVLFEIIRVSPIMRISPFVMLVGCGCWMVFLFAILFGFIYHARTFLPRKNCPSINVV